MIFKLIKFIKQIQIFVQLPTQGKKKLFKLVVVIK